MEEDEAVQYAQIPTLCRGPMIIRSERGYKMHRKAKLHFTLQSVRPMQLC